MFALLGARKAANQLWLPGIVAVLVSLMAGKAEVKYDPALTSAAAVARLIEDLGFGARLLEDNAVTHGKLDLAVRCHTKRRLCFNGNKCIYGPVISPGGR